MCVSRDRARVKYRSGQWGLRWQRGRGDYVGRADEREGTHEGEGVRALWEEWKKSIVQWYGWDAEAADGRNRRRDQRTWQMREPEANCWWGSQSCADEAESLLTSNLKPLLNHGVSRGENGRLHVSGVSGSLSSTDNSGIHPRHVPSSAANWKNVPSYCSLECARSREHVTVCKRMMDLWRKPAKNIFLTNEPVSYWAAEAKSAHPSVTVSNVQGYAIKTSRWEARKTTLHWILLNVFSVLSLVFCTRGNTHLLEKLGNWKCACLMLFRGAGSDASAWIGDGRGLEGHWTASLPNSEKISPGKGNKSGVKLKGFCMHQDKGVQDILNSHFSWDSKYGCKKNTRFRALIAGILLRN